MDASSLISDELRGLVGKDLTSLTKTTVIEKTLVEEFQDVVEYPNAMWETDRSKRVEYSRGDLVPPSLLWTRRVTYRGRGLAPLLPLLPPKGVDGGGEWEVARPVKIGDVITSSSRLIDVTEHQSKSRGKMLRVVMETTYTNQDSEVVGRYRHSSLRWY